MYVKYPLSLRNVEDLLAERGIDISHETVRFWWDSARCSPLRSEKGGWRTSEPEIYRAGLPWLIFDS